MCIYVHIITGITPIEKCFYQLKTYIRRDEPKKIINKLIIFYAGKIILRLFSSPMSYKEIKKSIKKAIKNITKDNLYNYFKSSLIKRDKKYINITKFMRKSKIVSFKIVHAVITILLVDHIFFYV
jgi:hypothetical protein